MQRILLLCCLFVSAFFASCGVFEHRQRIVLCQEITGTNDTLDRMTREWHTLLDRAVITKNFSTLNPLRTKLQQYISRKRSVIASLELPNDAQVLRESEGVFLTSQTAIIVDVYPKFEAYNELTPDSTIQRSLRAVAGDEDNELAWKLTIKKSLDAFVQKHGLKMEK